MSKKLFTLLAATVLAFGLIAAGCGGDDDETTDEPTVTEETTAEEETTAPEDAEAPPADIEQAVEACRENVQATPQLSDDVKSDLEELCEKAASGDEQEVREASREVCIKIVEETVPEGSAREQALSACEQAIE